MILCWYYRKVILNRLDWRAELPAGARAHLEKCPACARIYESAKDAVRQLSAAASAERREPSPFLHERIMASLRKAKAPAKQRRAAWSPAWSIGFAAACVLLAGILWFNRQSPSANNKPPVAQIQPAPVPPASLAAWPAKVNLTNWSARLDEPLRKEMTLVVNDARGAIDALAKDFIPESVRLAFLSENGKSEL